MLKKEEFRRWIKAFHIMFEIFEGRYDAYPLAKKWVQEWLSSKTFTVEEEHISRIYALIENFDYEVYSVKGMLKEKIDEQFQSLLKDFLRRGKHENVGFAISPYLFTWNFWRYKGYFEKKMNFSIEQYFRNLGEFLGDKIEEIEHFRNRRLIYEQVERSTVKKIFSEMNDELRELGIKNNEPVGVIKLLHVFAPYYFPLIDNDIGEATGLLHSYFVQRRRRLESLRIDTYLTWMNALNSWLQNYLEVIEKLENELHSSILKLVDEGLYMMSTVKLKTRVKELEIKVR